MQVRKKLAYAICFALFLPLFAQAQVKTTNSKGERIIVYPDGSWEYDKSKEATGNKAPAAGAANKAESDRKIRQEAVNARREEAEAIKTEKLAEKELDHYSASLQAQGDVPLSKDERLEQKNRLKSLKNDLKVATTLRKAASSKARLYEKMVDMPLEKREKELAKLKASEQKELDKIVSRERKNENPASAYPKQSHRPEMPPSSRPAAPVAAKQKNEAGPAPQTAANPYAHLVQQLDLTEKRDKEMEKYRTPIYGNFTSAKDCFFDVDEVDEFSGKHRRSLAARLFFTHTDENLRPYMNGKEFIVCRGAISEVGEGRLVLALTIVLQATDVAQKFGRLDDGSTLSLKLINGENVVLRNTRTDFGVVDNTLKQTVFHAYYPISAENAKLLSKSEVNKAKLVWSMGYDVFEIYEMDFFKEQLACFDR
jgi:hypothetical protein